MSAVHAAMTNLQRTIGIDVKRPILPPKNAPIFFLNFFQIQQFFVQAQIIIFIVSKIKLIQTLKKY